jgi:putative phosphoribosyl transferase
MSFRNRVDAGRKLARKLNSYAERDDVIVLGIPRGGARVAFEVAEALNVPFDVFLSHKLGVPGHEELAFGAVASGGVSVLDQRVVAGMDISRFEIERISGQVRREFEHRQRVYRGELPALDVAGLTVVLVDDGIATGSSMRAAVEALRRLRPARIVVATPVAPASTCRRLRDIADELVCVDVRDEFFAIGQFYEDFSQVTDYEVTELLRRARRHDYRTVAQANWCTKPGRGNSGFSPAVRC